MEGDVSYLAEQRGNLAKEVTLLEAKCTISVQVQDNRDGETRTVRVDVLAFDSIDQKFKAVSDTVWVCWKAVI